jgi:hypothetical protein
MAPVRKEDVIGLPVNMSPWDLLFLFLILSDLFFFWIIRDGFFVALQAGCNVRHPGKGLSFEVEMT